MDDSKLSKIEKVEQEIYDRKIDLVYRPLPSGIKSFALKDTSDKCIFMDKTQLGNYEHYFALKHELYHFDYDYTFYNLKTLKDKNIKEARIDNAMIKDMIDVDVLFDLIIIKNMPVYELPDILELPESFIRKAINIYENLECWITRLIKHRLENCWMVC